MAKLYFVSYDLNNQKNYQRLWDELARLGGKKVLLSLYGVRSTMSALDFCNHLRQFTDNDDGLLVVEGSGSWAFVNTLHDPRTI